MRKLLLAALLISASCLVAIRPSEAAPGDPPGPGRARADAVRSYWTKAKIENAKPRDLVRQGGPAQNNNRPVPAPDAGKPGGSGGTTSNGTGASWTNPGPVKSITGKILFHMGGGDWTCSGTVVNDNGVEGRSLVLTAGHCAYDEIAKQFATYWMFIPDYDSNGSTNWYFDQGASCPPDKCWVASALVSTEKWGSNSANKWEEDYAFAVIVDSENGGSLERAVGGSIPLDFSGLYSTQTRIDAFGYPAAKKYNGADLVYCSGNDHVLSDGLQQTTAIRCGMTGGASGGPWLKGFDPADQIPVGAVRSVTSYSYSSASGYLFGPIFDSYTQQAHSVATGATQSILVGPVG
jgi:hypothetical protein